MSLHDFGKRSVTSASSVISALSESRLATSSMLTIRTQSESAKITIAHRITMANKEIDEMKKKLEDFRKSARKQKARMRAEIEELEIRISEVHEAKDDFEEEVVFKGVDPITGRIPAERVIRFIEEWLRSVNTIIERLRLKSATIKMQIKKAKQQLIQREELGEALHAVDFEQLNIQNKDYARMIEEKNRYVFEMKKIAGHYHLKLTQHKQKLSNLMLSLNEVKKEIALKQQQIEELKIEREEVEIVLKRRDERTRYPRLCKINGGTEGIRKDL
ncbi:cilia- and flagella-associated protein 263 [Colletes latitarsis]|uniref:cilia- and flagella-associated protein 263 n=1 Tax=Colletes latitarsis TaxID=2605962 RepID=UPI00403590E3